MSVLFASARPTLACTLPRSIVTCLAGALLAVLALAAPASSRADTLTLSPTADAFTRASDPNTNFGAADYLDSQGGLNSSACGADNVQITGAAYSYLKFDLSQIPAGAQIQSASLQL